MAPYDILGNIVLVKFKRATSKAAKVTWARTFLKHHGEIKTVLEKTARIKGRLRTPTSRFIAGEKTKEALYAENGCSFRFNVDSCYFSPRLASERKELAEMIKPGERVLVMFGGAGPFAVVIAKTKKPSRVITVELGKIPSAYALENVQRNKVGDRVVVVQGDVRKKIPALREKFDRIVMARPNLEDSFLDVALRAIKPKGIIHYYGFYPEENAEKELTALIKRESTKAHRTSRIRLIKKAGDIGTRRYRYRVDVDVR